MERFVLLILLIAAVKTILIIVNFEGENYKAQRYIEKSLVRLPKTYLLIGSLCSIFFGVLLAIMVFSGEGIPVYGYIMALIFFIMSFSVVIAYFNWRIILKKDVVIYRTFFRREYTFQYKDIDKCVIKDDIIILSIKEKRRKFIIDPHSLGIELFINRIPPKRRK